MLARTKFQNISGTRCKVDFVETPSLLMEYFCRDYRVVKKFAKHFQTGEVLPAYLLKTLLESKDQFSALEMQNQIFYSMVDQTYHGPGAGSLDTTKTFESLQQRYYPIKYAANTAWQTNFTHLYGYGGGYYSYLSCKGFASQIWATCFSEDPLSRQAGERYRREILAHGGGKNPEDMIQAMLGGDKISTDALIAEVS